MIVRTFKPLITDCFRFEENCMTLSSIDFSWSNSIHIPRDKKIKNLIGIKCIVSETIKALKWWWVNTILENCRATGKLSLWRKSF